MSVYWEYCLSLQMIKGPSAKYFFQQVEETVEIAGWNDKFALVAFRSKYRGIAQEFLRDHSEVRRNQLKISKKL